MTILVLGLVIFLGLHSTRIVSESGRERAIARIGEGPWKGIYSLVSVIGFVLIVWGFARARYDAPQLWTPPTGARHITMLLMLVALILLASFLFKRSHIAVITHHPMLWAVLLWSAGHLFANGSAADLAAVRRLLRLVGRRSRELVRPRPAERRRLSRAAARRHGRRHRRWLGRLCAADWRPAPLAVRRVAARDVRRNPRETRERRGAGSRKRNIEFAPRSGS